MRNNELFSLKSIKTYTEQYCVTLCNTVAKVDAHELRCAIELLSMAPTVYVAGNGGSAAIADHWACDMSKGRWGLSGPAPRVVSLTAHTGLLTALANDISYEQVFAAQLEMADVGSADCTVLISSSGNSPNILAAARWCMNRGIPVIAFTGFDGGLLRANCTVDLHVPVNNYGVAEDAHQLLMHCLAQYLMNHSLVSKSQSP